MGFLKLDQDSTLDQDIALDETPRAAGSAKATPAWRVEDTLPAAPVADAPESDDELIDFEIVFGRTQIAGTALLVVVVLAVVSGVSYLVGKSNGSPTQAAPASPAAEAKDPKAAAPTAAKTGAPSASNVVLSSLPVVQEPAIGKTYFQVGAIDKGLAIIWAEGLRTHGFDAIVATGPTDKMWRVLIGPLADQQAYQRTKQMLDALGIQTFERKPAPPAPENALGQ